LNICVPSDCFNGAAALQRRRARWRIGGTSRRAASFNGAAALQRRRGHLQDVPAARSCGASMGPPLFSGGGALSIVQIDTKTMTLQWGRRSSAAEGRRGHIRRMDHGVVRFNGAAALQRRRGNGSTPRRFPNEEASMGPPLFSGGGKTPSASAFSLGQLASMGPPLFSGGGAWAFFLSLGGLVVVLQWGRRSSAAEGRTSPSSSWPRSRCFNGAAALQRRRAWAAVVQLSHADQASMGPPLFSGGGRERRRVVRLGGGASMGPPLFSGGGRAEVSACAGRCFERLQWGRRSSAAEGTYRSPAGCS